MSDEDGFFGEPVAARYDESSADMFAPGVVDRRSRCWRNWPAAAGRWNWASGPGASRCLRERWDGWTRAPFTSESGQHVSIWAKPAA